MVVLVADTSSLVSIGHAAGGSPDPISLLTTTYEVHIPTEVDTELQDIASYNDADGQAAQSIRSSLNTITIDTVTLDAQFPLDDGENAAVTLANDLDADLFLCDEFNSLGLIHASLAGPRLVTTPTLLTTLTKQGALAVGDARALLSTISSARSWTANSYVQRAEAVLHDL